MGLFTTIKSGFDTFLAPWKASAPPASVEVYDSVDFNRQGTQVVRDTGLQSRTFREALEVLSEAAPTMPGLSLFMDKYGFRSLTQNIRDISDSVRIGLLNRAETLSLNNGMAHRALQIRTDLIVSEGFKVEADCGKDCPQDIRERVQEVLDEHWELNEWQDRTYERVFDLGRTGELIRRIPPLFRDIAGHKEFKLGRFIGGNIAPQLVYGISLDPWNYERLDRLYLEQYAFPNSGSRDLSLKVLCDERLSSKEFGSIRGDVLYLGVNRRPGCSRGLTDLAPAIDWLDIYEQMLLMDCDRASMMMRFIWDVTISNASPAYIKAYAETLKVGGPKPGTVRVHSDKEVWDAVSPDLKLSDSKELREDIFIYAWGAMGLPRPWYSDGENSNRASIENMTDPQFQWARTRRRQFVQHLELEHRFALQVAYDCGRFADVPKEKLSDWIKLKVTSRDPDRKGYESVGATWNDIANALTVMVSQEFVDKQTATDVIRTVLGSYGFEVDPERMKVMNTQGPQTQAQLEDFPQAAIPGAQENGVGADGGSVGSNLPGQGGGGFAQQRESRLSRLWNGRRNGGLFRSRDPFQALLTEGYKALEKAKRNGEPLKRRY